MSCLKVIPVELRSSRAIAFLHIFRTYFIQFFILSHVCLIMAGCQAVRYINKLVLKKKGWTKNMYTEGLVSLLLSHPLKLIETNNKKSQTQILTGSKTRRGRHLRVFYIGLLIRIGWSRLKGQSS